VGRQADGHARVARHAVEVVDAQALSHTAEVAEGAVIDIPATRGSRKQQDRSMNCPPILGVMLHYGA
jgi:hypothetical protein